MQRRILEAARELFVAGGYEAVTMRQVADRVEYTPTALYFHFKDKDELLRRLCQEDFAKLAARLKVLVRVPDPLERLGMLARTYAAFALEHPHHYRWMHLSGSGARDGDSEPLQANRDLYRAIRSAVEAAGSRRAEFTDADLAAQTIWAAIHGAVSLEIAHDADPAIDWRPAKARTEAAITMALRGVFSGGLGVLSEG